MCTRIYVVTHTVTVEERRKKRKKEGGKEGGKGKKEEEKVNKSIKEKCISQQNFSNFSPPAELPAGGGKGGRVPLRGTLKSPA